MVVFTEKHLCQRFSCEFCKIFNNTFFTEHIWMNPSVLQQLLAIYFSMIYCWQLSRSKKSLVGQKFIHISQGFYWFRFLFFSFFIFHRQIPVYLASYAKHMLYSEQPSVLLTRRHLNTMVLTNFENVNSIFKHFRRTTWFLSFDGSSN